MRGAAAARGVVALPPCRTARPAVAQRLAVGREFGVSRKLTSGYLTRRFEESLARWGGFMSNKLAYCRGGSFLLLEIWEKMHVKA